MLIMYCNKVIFYRVPTFTCCKLYVLYAIMNHKLLQANMLSCAYISLLQAIRCCLLIINCSKVILYRVLICPCCKPNVVSHTQTSSYRPYISSSHHLYPYANHICSLKTGRKAQPNNRHKAETSCWYHLLPNVQTVLRYRY